MKLVVPKDVKSRPIMSKLAVLVSALIVHEIADSSSLTLDMQEAIGLSMSVMEVVARLGKFIGLYWMYNSKSCYCSIKRISCSHQ